MNEPTLRLENVATGYFEHPVIKDVSANIFSGEFVGLIGSNGTGKSTLLKAISDLLPIYKGRILIEGHETQKLSARERAKRVAVVPQSFNIDYDFKVREIVMMGRNPYIGPRGRETGEDRRIVEEAMRRTQTLQFADRKFNTLSGGERQKVIIARAIAQETEIILLDEPTSALDMHHAIEVMELIVELNREGRTVFAVLHDLNMAARYCDRLIMINEGYVIADGKPNHILTQKNLQNIYEMKILVRNNPLFHKPEVTPVRVKRAHPIGKGRQIHLICGADFATSVMEYLDDRDFRVTAGVVERDCGDELSLRELGMEYITTHPFSPVTIDQQRKNLELMKDAEAVYVTDIPFGVMNIMNLYDLEKFNGQIFMNDHIWKSDYTNGKLKEYIDKIQQKKEIHFVHSNEEFYDAIEHR